MNGYEIWVQPVTYEGTDPVDGPTPGKAGLKEDMAYRVIGMTADTDQHKEAFVTVINDEGEIWFISNRHVRVVQLDFLNKNSRDGTIRWSYLAAALE